eukprot:8529192-Heterocapsa_arctica.AAC.1
MVDLWLIDTGCAHDLVSIGDVFNTGDRLYTLKKISLSRQRMVVLLALTLLLCSFRNFQKRLTRLSLRILPPFSRSVIGL